MHDNASDIVLSNVPRYIAWESVNCFAYMLQVAINDGFSGSINHVIVAASRLVVHFHHSTTAARALERKQLQG